MIWAGAKASQLDTQRSTHQKITQRGSIHKIPHRHLFHLPLTRPVIIHQMVHTSFQQTIDLKSLPTLNNTTLILTRLSSLTYHRPISLQKIQTPPSHTLISRHTLALRKALSHQFPLTNLLTTMALMLLPIHPNNLPFQVTHQTCNIIIIMKLQTKLLLQPHPPKATSTTAVMSHLWRRSGRLTRQRGLLWVPLHLMTYLLRLSTSGVLLSF